MFCRNGSNRISEHFGSKKAKQVLADAGLADFHAVWQTDAAWVEAPNIRRNGWSGMSRVGFPESGRNEAAVYIKRQQDHCYRDACRGFARRPTAYREYRRLLMMTGMAASVPEFLYYAERQIGRHLQAVLVTREIPDAIAFDEYIRAVERRPVAEVRQVLRDTARLINAMHCRHFQHGALYGKHVLVANAGKACRSGRPAHTSPVPYLIDLEKCRRRVSRYEIAGHDLGQFYRHNPWRADIWEMFLEEYQRVGRINRYRLFSKDLVGEKVRRKKIRHARVRPAHYPPLPIS